MPITQKELEEWPTATLKDCRLAWADFSGRPTPYNKQGRRSFGVYMSNEDVELLQSHGVRTRRYENNGDEMAVVALGSAMLPPVLPSPALFDVEVYLYKWEWKDRKGTKLYFKKFL